MVDTHTCNVCVHGCARVLTASALAQPALHTWNPGFFQAGLSQPL